MLFTPLFFNEADQKFMDHYNLVLMPEEVVDATQCNLVVFVILAEPRTHLGITPGLLVMSIARVFEVRYRLRFAPCVGSFTSS